MFPATQCTNPAEIGSVVDSDVAAVTFTKDSALGMRRPKLAPLRNCFAIWADQPLGDIKAATLSFR